MRVLERWKSKRRYQRRVRSLTSVWTEQLIAELDNGDKFWERRSSDGRMRTFIIDSSQRGGRVVRVSRETPR